MSPRWLLAALVLAVSAAGCFDPLVGARCAEGYVPCQGRCVAVCGTDGGGQGPLGDGGLQTGDTAGSSGEAGIVPGQMDGGGLPPDGGGMAGDAGVTGPGDAGGGSGADGGGATDAGPGGMGADAALPGDGAPVDAATDAGAGDASVEDAGLLDASQADASTNDATLADAGPSPDAPPPIDCGAQTLCPIGCVNLADDPDNCGACGVSCGSGLCVSGVCQHRPAGHLVVIGHDYTVSRTAMDNLVGNAVFLAPRLSVKVLAYHGAATAEEINGTDAAIQKVANMTGRTWTKTVVPANDVQSSLAFADVFVIYAQAGATDATLLALGSSWATALSDFVQAGKVIVVLEGMYPNAGTYQIVQQANLFHATGRTEVTGQTMLVARPGDAIATRVPQTYRGERGTVWFATNDQTVVVQVVTDAGILPVVVHMVF